MSLLGVDVGSSSTKVAAFTVDGHMLAAASEAVSAIHTGPGTWEVDPNEVWNATVRAVRTVATHPATLSDPPIALAVSAAGREIFPVSPNGDPLGTCLRTADQRRARQPESADTTTTAEDWAARCGHVPDHMDPFNRLLWWREERADLFHRAERFVGWHEFLALRLCGRPVIDPSLAGKFLAYDISSAGWSTEILDRWNLDPRLFAEIGGWGTQVGTLRSDAAADLSLPESAVLAVGGFDTSCAALGSGAVRTGHVGLVAGSWECVVAPTDDMPKPARLSATGLSLGPHPSRSGLGVFGLSPNGTAVLDWARALTGQPVDLLDAALLDSDLRPSPVLAVPHLSGAPVWAPVASSTGSLLGLTLATSELEIVKAFMEGIAYDLVLAVDALRALGVELDLLRASGGGAASAWWMQLKADLTGLPVETVNQPEGGAFGAAVLAGVAVGAFSAVDEATEKLVRRVRRYEPDPRRTAAYEPRVHEYKAALQTLEPIAHELAPTQRESRIEQT